MPLLLSLLSNKWTWIALLLAGLAAWGQIQTWRLHSAQADLAALRGEYAERDRQAQAEADKRLQEAVARVRAAEDKSAADVAAVSAKLQKDNHDALQQKDRIIGDLHTGALALRVQLSTQGPGPGDRAAADSAGPSPGQRDAGTASGLLSEDDSAFLLWESLRADQIVAQLNACQGIIISDRHIFGVENVGKRIP